MFNTHLLMSHTHVLKHRLDHMRINEVVSHLIRKS